MPNVKVEGANVDLPDEVCRTNKGVIDALLPFYPGVANAEIKRDKKSGEITVSKKAGKKGSYQPVVTALDRAPETLSRLLTIDATKKPISAKQLDEAILESIDEEVEIARVLSLLDEADPEPANELPRGF